MPRRRSDDLNSSSSDESVMLKQVTSTHAPDGQVFDVRALLQAAEEIFLRAKPSTQVDHASQVHLDKLDNEAQSDILDLFPCTMYKISCEMCCRSRNGGDAHASAINMLNMLSKFTWDVKAALSLAAFAVIYGEFWLVYQLYLSNPLAKAVALVKQLPDMQEQADALKPQFESSSSAIKAMVDLTNTIIKLKELPTEYISPEAPELLAATDLIPTATYWIIRSCIACASQVVSLIGMANEYMAYALELKSWELSSLANKICNIDSHLRKQLILCDQIINERKQVEAYKKLVRLVETLDVDNMRILQALLHAKDDQLPLYDCNTKRKVSLDVLRRKNVLLLISDMDVSFEELSNLRTIYTEARHYSTSLGSRYEWIWLPIVDTSIPWNAEKQKVFENLQAEMVWYSISHPLLLDPTTIKYIKEKWKFNNKSMVVVLDPQGRVVHRNAIHMMWIWGITAAPFTRAREEALWREETWRVELIIDGIDPTILSWISEEKFICFYGGVDLEWIRDFAKTAREVARAASIPLEMVYVGKSKTSEKMRRILTIIRTENLGRTLNNSEIWFFWMRLESMWYSKMQHGKSPENDQVMEGVTTMLMYDNAHPGWTILSRGSHEITKATGDTMLKCLMDFGTWKDETKQKGFMLALRHRLLRLSTREHCNHLVLPGLSGELPDQVVCAECKRPMEKYIMYCCCTD